MKQYKPSQRILYDITASAEDNLWHMIKEGAKFTLCGREPRRSRFIEPTTSQEVMARLTEKEDFMDCQDCKEIARNERDSSNI